MTVYVLTYTNPLNEKTEVASVFATFQAAAAAAHNLMQNYSGDSIFTQDTAFDAKKLDSGTESLHFYSQRDEWIVVEGFEVEP